jgi:hypothetical protein
VVAQGFYTLLQTQTKIVYLTIMILVNRGLATELSDRKNIEANLDLSDFTILKKQSL